MRKQIAILLAAAFVPATWIVWIITDHFQANSILAWAPGWLESDPGFALPSIGSWFVKLPSAVGFWIYNFGLTLPVIIALVGVIGWRMWKVIAEGRSLKSRLLILIPFAALVSVVALSVVLVHWGWDIGKLPIWSYPIFLLFVGLFAWYTWKTLAPLEIVITDSFAFAAPAVAIFLVTLFVKTAPWGWDNTKLMIWAYFIVLPFLWRDLIAKWPVPVRVGVCFVLFASGFVSLFGGLATGAPGYDIAERTELNVVAAVLRKIPIKERFAAFPTYNHPLLLNGRKVVLGYPGHLWTQGFDYAPIEQQLKALMLGAPDWRERASTLQARYLFWGDEEKRAYASSPQPWRNQVAVVATGLWGTIYDLQSPASPPRQ
jgi:hypothetical protein